MPASDRIFVSAVSKELASAREQTVKALQERGFSTEWQDIFPAEQGQVAAMLRKKIDRCRGVIQLVGERYGAEPIEPDPDFGRVSYTQYEAMYAHQKKKLRVWYILIQEDYPRDAENDEPDELRQLQAEYRRGLENEDELFHTVSTPEQLHITVLRMEDRMDKLWRKDRLKHWLHAVTLAMVVLAVGGLAIAVWQSRNSPQVDLLGRVAEAEAEISQDHPSLAEQAVRQRALTSVAAELGRPISRLRNDLEEATERALESGSSRLLDRAKAKYLTGSFRGAENLALGAAEGARVVSDGRSRAVKAYQYASWAAERDNRLDDAIRHIESARDLIDGSISLRRRIAVEQQAALLALQAGRSEKAAKRFQQLIQLREALPGKDRSAERTRTLRRNLAIALYNSGKFKQAAKAIGQVLQSTPDTERGSPRWLFDRNLEANIEAALGDYAAAEKILRAALEKSRGLPEGRREPRVVALLHLANMLNGRGKYQQAEQRYLDTNRIAQKRHEPGDPLLYKIKNSRAWNLLQLDEPAKARKLAQTAIDGLTRAYGRDDHPQVLRARDTLANALTKVNEPRTANQVYTSLIRDLKRVSGEDHPTTLATHYHYAKFLRDRPGRTKAALWHAKQAAKGAVEVYPENHSTREKYTKLLAAIRRPRHVDAPYGSATRPTRKNQANAETGPENASASSP